MIRIPHQKFPTYDSDLWYQVCLSRLVLCGIFAFLSSTSSILFDEMGSTLLHAFDQDLTACQNKSSMNVLTQANKTSMMLFE